MKNLSDQVLVKDENKVKVFLKRFFGQKTSYRVPSSLEIKARYNKFLNSLKPVGKRSINKMIN